MAALCHLAGMELKPGFLPLAVEVVQDTQPFGSVQLHALGTQGRKVGNEVGPHAGKVGAGLLHIFFHHGDGDIFFLDDAVAARGLV